MYASDLHHRSTKSAVQELCPTLWFNGIQLYSTYLIAYIIVLGYYVLGYFALLCLVGGIQF